MDSQDVLAWGEVKPEWTFEERKRLDYLCEWGKQYGIDGFVRCGNHAFSDALAITYNKHLQKNGNEFVSCVLA